MGRLQVRARSVPLVPQGFSFLAGDSRATKRDWEAEAVTRIDPADHSGLFGKLPKPSPGPESLPRSRHSELRGTGAGQGEWRTRFCLLPFRPTLSWFPSFLSVWPWKGEHLSQNVPGVSDRPGVERTVDEVRLSTWELVLASRDF